MDQLRLESAVGPRRPAPRVELGTRPRELVQPAESASAEGDTTPLRREAELDGRPEEELIAEHLAFLDESLEMDATDRSFERDAWAEASAALGEEPFRGSSLNEVSCGEALCRFIVNHEEGVDTSAFAPRFIKAMSARFSQFYLNSQPGAGGGRTVAFMARDGHRIPPPPAREVP